MPSPICPRKDKFFWPYRHLPTFKPHFFSDLSSSWAGGEHGTEFLFSTLLPAAANLRYKTGVIYLIAIAENRIEEISNFVSKEFGLRMEIVLKRKAGREMLYLLKLL